MNKIFSLLFLISTIALSQNTEPDPKSQMINSRELKGFTVTIKDEFSATDKAWQNELDETGKYEVKRNYYLLTEIAWEGIYSNQVQIYSYTRKAEEDTQIWIGVDTSSLSQTEYDQLHQQSKDFLERFAVNYYRQNAQNRISEAERVVSYYSKSYQEAADRLEKLDQDSLKTQSQIERLEKKLADKEKVLEEIKNELNVTRQSADSLSREVAHFKEILQKYREEIKKWE